MTEKFLRTGSALREISELRNVIEDILQNIGVVSAASLSDPIRWNVADLATDITWALSVYGVFTPDHTER